jgi:squalene-hopene/tetraprenyl-beta-curcumene cyclase
MRAIAAAGLPKSDPYWARAARFVTRCQNLRSSNDQPWAGNDGGFVFAPGFSFAGATRSYGSMTYAGLGAYWAAAIPRNDPRVEAALAWIRSNFTAAANPGLDRQALYHSFYYMSHTLSRWGIEQFHDGAGQPRAWRAELGAALLARQSADGSWANADDPRWLESRPVLATSFALTALNEIAGRRP